MTRKFIIYSMPFMILFLCVALFEPWIYRNIVVSPKIDKSLKDKYVEVIAHKGASALAPENTMASIGLALQMGVDMIEIDVRNTKDEQIVVFHDETLDRTTDGTGLVHDYTLEEIKKLDAGAWFGDAKYVGERVPTLKEVLDSINGRCKVLIEIKHMDHPHYHDFAEKLIDVIRKEKNGYDWVILQSYEDKYLEAAHEYDDHVQTKKILIGEDSTPLIAFYVETRLHLGRAKLEGRLSALNPEFSTISTRRVFRMHAHGFKVYTYPVNTREDMVKMMHMGIDGIITDHPEIMMELRQEINAL
ncbi:glycerophosphodiester phosphodiesterase family protein [Marinoscillum sp. MHG1-6]|uniref:glycerophosphodiester phosphodiesterase n=1 Tax=Marinoscillum sp. MHG1-6 TaxID=2959627 RepID=UPI0021589A70|nr:glycerophosphodiester phosphodiesterase family protein [Marinoscillum sp. MHG1-6]